MAASSTAAVLSALVGNSVIAVLKFAVFFTTGSGTMLSEAAHTLADAFNQGLLFIGIRRSERPPDAMFAYGYGGERYFFALMSAVGIFLLGCGVTVYHGVHSLLHPPELDLNVWIFVVLGLSFAVSSYVLALAWRAVREQMGNRGVVEFMRSLTDPTAVAVLLEDFAACIGVVIALVAIGLTSWTGDPMWDSIGSILIGLMLGAIAVWLGYQNRLLILGRRIPESTRRSALEYLNAQPSVESVRAVQSRVIGSNDFKLKAEIDFDGRALGALHAAWVREQRSALAGDAACDAFAAEFGERMMHSLAEEIDRLETDLRARHPELRYVDFEAD